MFHKVVRARTKMQQERRSLILVVFMVFLPWRVLLPFATKEEEENELAQKDGAKKKLGKWERRQRRIAAAGKANAEESGPANEDDDFLQPVASPRELPVEVAKLPSGNKKLKLRKDGSAVQAHWLNVKMTTSWKMIKTQNSSKSRGLSDSLNTEYTSCLFSTRSYVGWNMSYLSTSHVTCATFLSEPGVRPACVL